MAWIRYRRRLPQELPNCPRLLRRCLPAPLGKLRVLGGQVVPWAVLVSSLGKAYPQAPRQPAAPPLEAHLVEVLLRPVAAPVAAAVAAAAVAEPVAETVETVATVTATAMEAATVAAAVPLVP